ncbi:MAG: ribosomal-processing cysteine protease Prp [Bacilli bacterium]|nr:ribosomal-processing cysteine protease Prp [Bacilli bacterium]
MIIVNLIKSEVGYKEITIEGHSGYEVIGKDIVCSAVSTAFYLSLGLLEKVSKDFKYFCDEKNAKMKLQIAKPSDMSNLILENLVEYLTSISKQYTKYVKILNN